MPINTEFSERCQLPLHRLLILWLLFFSICAGLGYPILNRYDPTEVWVSDTRQYAEIAREGPGLSGRNSYRILQPLLLARPIYRLVRGRLGSWNPMSFALLCSCSIFTAATVTLLLTFALRSGADPATAVLSSCLFVLNFVVPNSMLSGLVDASVAFLLFAAAWAMSRNFWIVLPALGALGALAHETYVVIGTALAFGWYLVQFRRRRAGWLAFVAVIGMGAAGLVTYTMLRTAIDGTILLPWRFAQEQRSEAGVLQGFLTLVGDPGFYYSWVWMVPLGVWRLNKLPPEWVLSSLFAAGVTLFLTSFHSAGGGNAARVIFNAIGPVFSLGAACFLTDFVGRPRESIPPQ